MQVLVHQTNRGIGATVARQLRGQARRACGSARLQNAVKTLSCLRVPPANVEKRCNGLALSMVIVAAFSGLSACTQRQIYETAQGNQALECQKFPDSRYEECMKTIEQSFDNYQLQRQADALASQEDEMQELAEELKRDSAQVTAGTESKGVANRDPSP
ncbi:MAG: hypothetical protein AAF756_20735 [Pseudomonadota bacterium]